MNDDLALVTGGGGFIGGHLVAALQREGFSRIRSVDIKPLPEWFQVSAAAENLCLDLSLRENCRRALRGARSVYHLAANMGGMGFIEAHRALCMLSVLIDTHMLVEARDAGVERFFYASSACVYNVEKQRSTDVTPLREGDAYPALPEDGYGWQKLFSERMCRHFGEDFGLTTRVARFHNIYGPYGAWEGGREKAPAAICRKVIQAAEERRREIEIWGNGKQTRSFTYIDDCLTGIRKIMDSDLTGPINLGSAELVSIDRLVDLVEDIAGIHFERRYDPNAARGVNGRSSDNQRIRKALGWEPGIPLRVGLEGTYAWVRDRYRERYTGL